MNGDKYSSANTLPSPMNKMERSLSTRECKPISIEAPRLSRWAGTSILQRRHHRLQRYKMEKSCVPTEKRKEAYKCKVTPLLKNKNVAWRHLPYRATGTERRTYAILCVHARVPHRHWQGNSARWSNDDAKGSRHVQEQACGREGIGVWG